MNDVLFLQQDDFIYIVDNYTTPLADWERITYLLRNAYNQKLVKQNATAISNTQYEPVLEEWENTYVVSDAKASVFTAGSSGNATLYFNTFGKGHTAKEIAAAKSANIGFAISSPLLLLREGIRTITLTLVFKNTGMPGNLPKTATPDQNSSLPFLFL